jgi:hypothetical protein
MWALATSTSAQPLAVSNALYIEARQRLVDLENSGEAHQLDDLMQAQAWLLLAIYELMRVDFRWGWLSAGRAFRRIQLIRLHEMDRCVDTLSPQEWTSCEESRRTFWMAYALDCFVSLGTDSARTLSEDVRDELRCRPGRDYILMSRTGRRPNARPRSKFSVRTTCNDELFVRRHALI